jgi:hypothetical protein
VDKIDGNLQQLVITDTSFFPHPLPTQVGQLLKQTTDDNDDNFLNNRANLILILIGVCVCAGGVKVVFDVGFQREEVNTPNVGIDFANTQVHVATIRRYNRGRRVEVQVDNYPSVEHTFEVSDASDTILDKPKYLYVGNNG